MTICCWEVVIKDMGDLSGVSLILLKKGKALGRGGGFSGSRHSCMASVNTRVLPFTTTMPF